VRLVLDASVAIKAHVSEPDSVLAVDWLGRATSVLVPDIFFVEVGQALLRHHREGRLAYPDVKSAMAELALAAEVPLTGAALLPRALDLAQALSHGLHDCMYLSLAERCHCPVLTAECEIDQQGSTTRRADRGPSPD
jgi:predicted nucleic acid-binding protein